MINGNGTFKVRPYVIVGVNDIHGKVEANLWNWHENDFNYTLSFLNFYSSTSVMIRSIEK